MTPFSKEIADYLKTLRWKYAKTYRDSWPHEYVVRTDLNDRMYAFICRHIDRFGERGRFYNKIQLYHHEGGFSYWYMVDGSWESDRTGIINRTPTGLYFGKRMEYGLGPDSPLWKAVAPQLYVQRNGSYTWSPDLDELIEAMYNTADKVEEGGKDAPSDSVPGHSEGPVQGSFLF